MLSSINVSLNKLQMPLFAKKQTNPIKLSQNLRTDVFEKTTNVSNISFTSVDNSIVGKSIRELNDVPCPYCGIKIINGKEISHLNKDNLGGASKKAIKLLQPFEDRMHPVEKQVFHLLKDLSKKSPNKNLRQLLDSVRPEHLENIKQQETAILNKISKLASTIEDKESAKKLDNLLFNSLEILENQDPNYIFRRRRFLEKLNIITKKMDDKEKAQEILAIANEIPRAHDNISAFVVKFSQKDASTKLEKTPYQIGLSLVEPSIGSLEHIVPRHPIDGKYGGKNTFENYLYASKGFNSARKNMPFDKWVEKNPKIKQYAQNYIDAVIEKINNKQALQRCKIYPIIVAKTLEKESKGLIKLDTSKLNMSKKEISKELNKYYKERTKSEIKKTNNKLNVSV